MANSGTTLRIGTSGLDGNNLAFFYTLTDGRSGIAMASASAAAAPEPGTLALLALGGGLVIVKRRRK